MYYIWLFYVKGTIVDLRKVILSQMFVFVGSFYFKQVEVHICLIYSEKLQY